MELDGGQHLEQVTQDEERTRRLAALGYRVLRFWNDELLKNTEAVLGVILEALARAAPHPNPLPEGERESNSRARGDNRNLAMPCPLSPIFDQ